MRLTSQVIVDQVVSDISRMFDYEFTGESSFDVPVVEGIPEKFNIGLVVGPSGSGKTSILKTFGEIYRPKWREDLAVCTHFGTAENAQRKLTACGFSSVPDWVKPYHALSNGQQFRANMARAIKDGAVIDEFSSVVDRVVAKSCSAGVERYIRSQSITNVIFASCHYDIIEWLRPDWIYDTATNTLNRGCLPRPKIRIELAPCSVEAWALFRRHHYLTGEINRGARCWVGLWDGTPVGFAAMIAFPNQHFDHAWRGHRTVVLPDYQGLGIGMAISDAVGEMVVRSGGRYFSKTAHIRMGKYRNKSPFWKATTKNGKARKDYTLKRRTKEDGHKMRHRDRVCYSHEYIGGQSL